MAVAVGDAGNLLHVDVDQLAGASALVADGRDGPAAMGLSADALSEQLAPPRGQPCVRMLGHGRPLPRWESRQLTAWREFPTCHYPDVNNLLVLNN